MRRVETCIFRIVNVDIQDRVLQCFMYMNSQSQLTDEAVIISNCLITPINYHLGNSGTTSPTAARPNCSELTHGNSQEGRVIQGNYYLTNF